MNITKAQARVLRAIAHYEAKTEQKGATQYTCSKKVPNKYHVSGSTFNDNIKKLQEKLMVYELEGTEKTKPFTINDIGQIAWLRYFPIEENLEIIQKIFPNILISKIDDVIDQIQSQDIELIKNKFAQSVLRIALNNFHIEQGVFPPNPFLKLVIKEIIDLSSCYDLIKTSFKRNYTIMHPSILDKIKQIHGLYETHSRYFKNYDELEINVIDRVTFLFYYVLIQSISDEVYAGHIVADEMIAKNISDKIKSNEIDVSEMERFVRLSGEVAKKKNKIMKIVTSNNIVRKIIEKNIDQLKEYKNTDFQEISDLFIKK